MDRSSGIRKSSWACANTTRYRCGGIDRSYSSKLSRPPGQRLIRPIGSKSGSGYQPSYKYPICPCNEQISAPMPPLTIYNILQAILETIEPGNRLSLSLLSTQRYNKTHPVIFFTVPDEAVEKLGVLFSEQLLLAALDLIDRDCGKSHNHSAEFIYLFLQVVNYISPWGRSHTCVLGMTGSYTVFPSLHRSSSMPSFCTCPAFAYTVLISHSQIVVRVPARFNPSSSFERYLPQCKHVLATLIAQRLSKCVVREMNQDDFVSVLARQNPEV
jgi:SWIM zinc finger